MLKYTVKIAWDTEYEFGDGGTALKFAEIAVGHSVTERSKSVSIVITNDVIDDIEELEEVEADE